jgi:cold shock protein
MGSPAPCEAFSRLPSCGLGLDGRRMTDLPKAGGGELLRQNDITMASFENAGPRGSGPMRATVKWFNPTKGFGFVTLEDGTDAFCHASALASLPSPNLQQGATVMCDVGQGQRGMQVTAVHSVDNSTADPMPQRGFGDRGGDRFGGGGGGFRGDKGDRGDRGDRGGFGGGGGFRGPREPSGPMGDGHVKFFNEQKGFGFVVPESGGGDVYVHASALRRSGIPTLSPDQRIRFSTRQGMKGVEVDRIELA